MRYLPFGSVVTVLVNWSMSELSRSRRVSAVRGSPCSSPSFLPLPLVSMKTVP